MASWLKVAEDIFEVVDRRAKSVVNDLADERSDSKSPAVNGQQSQSRRKRSKQKAQLRPSSNEPSKTSDAEQEQTSVQPSADNNVEPSTDKMAISSEKTGEISTQSIDIATKNMETGLNDDDDGMPVIPSSEVVPGEVKHDSATAVENHATVSDVEVANSSTNGDITIESKADVHDGPSSVLVVTGAEDIGRGYPTDAEQNSMLVSEDVPSKSNHEESEINSVETHTKDETHQIEPDQKGPPPLDPKKQQEHRSDSSPLRVQEQLDEAQGLLKTAVLTGQSKEARLAKVCAGLSSRLQEYKSENAQLEELLVTERDRSSSYEVRIKQLQQDLTASKIEVSRVESNMSEALAAKNTEIETLISSMDVLKKQAAVSEGKLASLQANMESILRSRELSETRMMQALREELASAERRAEEEHAAHNATKMAAMEREVELEHRALEASTALARTQRTADERASKAADLEHKLVLLEAECASLNQELQDMETRVRREQKRPPEEANQALQVQAWQDEVERARQGQRDAESKLTSMEAEMQKMRVEMAGMKRDAEHYSRQEHMELEKRYRELTDLLYYKQTQLESMASEKAAAEFQLEKEAKRLQEAQIEAERSRVPRRASSSWEEDTDLKALEPLPLHHRHMAGASLQLQKAAKLLDSGAVSATRFLWRYPVARIILLFYLVFVHFFLMYLLHRLQEQADNFAAGEVAASMGLAIPNLP